MITVNQPTQEATEKPSVFREGLLQPTYPWIAQQDETDCGVAALTMIARAHGLAASLSEVRRQISVGPQGCSLAELKRVAESLGLSTRAIRIGLDHLPGMPLPALVHLTDGHYVAVYAWTSASVVVGDPARGIVQMGLWEFQRSWSGAALLVGPKEG